MKHKLLIIFVCLLSFEGFAKEAKRSASILSVTSLGASFLIQWSSPAQESTRVVVYPNPAKDRIWIKGYGATYIEMVNLLGDVVLKEEVSANAISISDLQSGIYIARVYDAERSLIYSTKITKQ